LVSSSLIDKLVAKIFFLCAFSSVFIVFAIFIYILNLGYPQILQWFMHGFGLNWYSGYGVLSYVFYSLYTGAGATVLAAIVGIPCAIYLAEYANMKVRNILKPSLEVLTSLPSILIGLIGVVLVVATLASFFGVQNGQGVLAAWIVLFVLSLPLIASVSEDAIRSVPAEQKEASLALGATRWQTTLKVSVPGAMSGIIASLILAMGSAIGETMAVWMVVGGGAYPSTSISLTSLFGTTDTIPTLIAMNYNKGESSVDQLGALAAAAFLLFVIVGVLNIAIRLALRKRKETG
jgi:phosphate transport system permease protein